MRWMTDAFRTTLQDFAAFLARPRLLEPAGLRNGADWRGWGTMLALYLAGLLFALGPLIRLWQVSFDLPSPAAFDQFKAATLLPLVVLAAPIGEEIVFRGWLTGRPRALWLVLCAMLAAVLAVAMVRHVAEAAAGIVLLAVLAAALAGWTVLRKRRRAPAWFERAFPVLFYLSVVIFALSHLANHDRVGLVMLPLVLPQLWAGLVLGFVRMRFGLPASMLLHALANGAAIGLALAG